MKKRIQVSALLLVLILMVGTLAACGGSDEKLSESAKTCNTIIDSIKAEMNNCTRSVVAANGSQLTLIGDKSYAVYYVYDNALYKTTITYDPEKKMLGAVVKEVKKLKSSELNGTKVADDVISLVATVGTDSVKVNVTVMVSSDDQTTKEETIMYNTTLKESMSK